MTPKCPNCTYWKSLFGGQREDGTKCCYFCIENGRIRKRNGDECLSFEPIKKVK